MSGNIQSNTTGRLTSCLQKKIDKTIYFIQVHFSSTTVKENNTMNKDCTTKRNRTVKEGCIMKGIAL